MTKLVLLTGDKDNPTTDVSVTPIEGDRYTVTIGDESFDVEGFPTERGVSFRLNGASYDLPIDRRGDMAHVATRNNRYSYELVDERVHKMRTALGAGAGALKPELVSPMTGKVVVVSCAVGESVEAGQTLVIIEAMKMENEIKAPGNATVTAVKVGAGDLVNPGDVLVKFEFDAEA